MNDKTRIYSVSGRGRSMPPNYERTVRCLTDEELEDEILGKRGEPGYQLALVKEHDRRANAGNPVEAKSRGALPLNADEWEA